MAQRIISVRVSAILLIAAIIGFSIISGCVSKEENKVLSEKLISEEKIKSFKLKLEGVLVQIDVNKDNIIENEFNKLLKDPIAIIDSNNDSVTFITKKPVSKNTIDLFTYNYGESSINGNQVTLITTKEIVISSFLGNRLESDVVPILYNGIEMYEIRKNVSLELINDILARVNGSVTLKDGQPEFFDGVSNETLDLVMGIFKDRIEMFHMNNVSIHRYENSYIIIDMPSIMTSESMDHLLGETGKFELRITTDMINNIDNESYSNITKISKHVLYGDSIKNVSNNPEKSGNVWGVSFQLTETGANKLRDAAMRFGLVNDPSSHEVIMFLNENIIFLSPFSPQLAKEIKNKPIYDLVIATGTDDKGFKNAERLITYLRASMLPVNVKVVSLTEYP